ncbi:MAG TPA: hypothetical protein VN903_11415 [Polyangia bacterium]|nr:hypothetical protein [Polyangia bacterium]
MDRDEFAALALALERRMAAMERRQDDWIEKADRTLIDLREGTELHLQKLGRLLRTLDDSLVD